MHLGHLLPLGSGETYRWKASHTTLDGRRLQFTGSAVGLFILWIKWLLLIIVTLGISGFWVYPRLLRWTTEHQTFAQ